MLQAFIIIHSPDTDVYVLSVAHLEDIGGKLYLKTGVENKARIVCINDTVQKLSLKVRDVDVSIHDYCNGILGVYCFTGCDTISAMVGKGKLKALKIFLRRNCSLMLLTSWDNPGNWTMNWQQIWRNLFADSMDISFRP